MASNSFAAGTSSSQIPTTSSIAYPDTPSHRSGRFPFGKWREGVELWTRTFASQKLQAVDRSAEPSEHHYGSLNQTCRRSDPTDYNLCSLRGPERSQPLHDSSTGGTSRALNTESVNDRQEPQGRSDTHHGDGDQRPPPHPDLDWLPSSRPFTAHSIREDVHSLMSPTYKVLGLLRESLASGAQRELAGRLWATAWTPAPWVLARNVCDRALKAWRAQPPDADDISR